MPHTYEKERERVGGRKGGEGGRERRADRDLEVGRW